MVKMGLCGYVLLYANAGNFRKIDALRLNLRAFQSQNNCENHY